MKEIVREEYSSMWQVLMSTVIDTLWWAAIKWKLTFISCLQGPSAKIMWHGRCLFILWLTLLFTSWSSNIYSRTLCWSPLPCQVFFCRNPKGDGVLWDILVLEIFTSSASGHFGNVGPTPTQSPLYCWWWLELWNKHRHQCSGSSKENSPFG